MTDSKNTIGRRAMRRKNTVGIITFLCLLTYTVFLFTPFYTIIVSSFTQNSEIMQTREFIWIPSKISLEGFEKIFSVSSTDGSSLFLSGFFNTMWQTLIPLVIGLFVSGFAAYCYSKLTFPFKEKLFLVEIATMTMPLGAFGIISCLFYSWLGWESSALPIIIPGMFGSATMIFFLRTYFDGISDEILEAAKMDGSGVFRNFFTLIAPIALPAFIAQFIFGFVSGYNNYASALMYLSAEKELWPLQLVLSNVVSDPQISPYFNAKCAAALVGMLPLVILFCFMQNYFIEGIAVGGSKE